MATTPSAQYSITIRVQFDSRQKGAFARLTAAIGDAGGGIAAVDTVGSDHRGVTRELVVNASDLEGADAILAAAGGIDGIAVLESWDRTFRMHQGGKIELEARVPLEDRDDISVAAMPGVAQVCRAIADDPDKAFELTLKSNMVAVDHQRHRRPRPRATSARPPASR